MRLVGEKCIASLSRDCASFWPKISTASADRPRPNRTEFRELAEEVYQRGKHTVLVGLIIRKWDQ